MLLQLGEFQFSISTLVYDELVRNSSVRWARQAIVGGDERLQAVGRNNDTIRLAGVFYPQVAAQVGGTVGTQSLDDLRTTMKGQEPQVLVSADGLSLGYWVIEEIEVANSLYVSGTGSVPRQQRFTISMRWYGDVPAEVLIRVREERIQLLEAELEALES